MQDCSPSHEYSPRVTHFDIYHHIKRVILSKGYEAGVHYCVNLVRLQEYTLATYSLAAMIMFQATHHPHEQVAIYMAEGFNSPLNIDIIDESRIILDKVMELVPEIRELYINGRLHALDAGINVFSSTYLEAQGDLSYLYH